VVTRITSVEKTALKISVELVSPALIRIYDDNWFPLKLSKLGIISTTVA
jgi:hypothetical protein